jgi:hypothetical protein
MQKILLCTLGIIVSTAMLHAEETPTFEKDIGPIFQKKCVSCHNASNQKGELDLTTPFGVFKGGESQSTLVSGDLESSYLYELVHSRMMPPDGEGEPLTDAEIHKIEVWIKNKTPFADGTDPASFIAASEVNQHDIQPIMLLRCTVCHGNRRQEGGLDLRTKASMLKGGASGPAIILGKPEESLIIKRMAAEEMPPRDKLLPSGVKVMPGNEVDLLKRWIELGGPEVDVAPDIATVNDDPLVSEEDRDYWAFRKPIRPALPATNEDVAYNAIDLFVLRKQREAGLEMSVEASRGILIRRVYFDLTGLPPSPEEVDAFAKDDSPNAYEEMVERVLALPAYGERWARYWLDAAGYADSEGKRSADPIRKSAWRYRDYVIRAFSKDLPYSEFLRQQIAGDELLDYSDPEKITDQHVDNLVATGFLRMAPDGTGSDVVNSVAERMEVVADEIDIFSSTVLGLTMKCARCHTHKYDPIPQRDYYRLMAVFQGAYDVHDWLKPTAVPGQSNGVMSNRTLMVSPPELLAEVEKHNKQKQTAIDLQNARLKKLQAKLQADYLEKGLAALPEVIRADVKVAFATDINDHNEIQRYLHEKFQDALELSDKALKADKVFAALTKEVDETVKVLEEEKRETPTIRALWDRGQPSPTYIYVRGDYTQSGRLVGPGVPSVLTDGKTPFELVAPEGGAVGTGRRLALANWLVDGEHPLTSRVMVNRIWSHHFGQGIVSSVDNFGKLGALPSHPELLDWLAVEFVESGWSVKHMHRLMLQSRVYRQVSGLSEELLVQDPENVLLTRMPLRRLSAEEVRDSVISVAGMLEQSRFGEPDAVNVRKDGLVTAIGKDGAYRRSVYLRQRRKEMPSWLETFDLPQMNPACQTRSTSNVAQQALYLLNSEMVRELAKQFAKRIMSETRELPVQVERMYLNVYSRRPQQHEVELSVEALTQLKNQWEEYNNRLPENERDAVDLELRALTIYGHTLLNSAGFLYVD